MRVLRRLTTVGVAAVLGAGFAACGEDREGDVQFQDGTGTETTGTGTTGTGTTGTETTGTEPTGTETTGTETSP